MKEKNKVEKFLKTIYERGARFEKGSSYSFYLLVRGITLCIAFKFSYTDKIR